MKKNEREREKRRPLQRQGKARYREISSCVQRHIVSCGLSPISAEATTRTRRPPVHRQIKRTFMMRAIRNRRRPSCLSSRCLISGKRGARDVSTAETKRLSLRDLPTCILPTTRTRRPSVSSSLTYPLALRSSAHGRRRLSVSHAEIPRVFSAAGAKRPRAGVNQRLSPRNSH